MRKYLTLIVMYLLIVTMTKSVDEIEVISEVFTDAVKAKKGSKNKQSGKYHTSYYITIPKDIAKKLNLHEGERIIITITKIKPKT